MTPYDRKTVLYVVIGLIIFVTFAWVIPMMCQQPTLNEWHPSDAWQARQAPPVRHQVYVSVDGKPPWVKVERAEFRTRVELVGRATK